MSKVFLILFLCLPLSLFAKEENSWIKITKILVPQEDQKPKVFQGGNVLSYGGGDEVTLWGKAFHPSSAIVKITLNDEDATLTDLSKKKGLKGQVEFVIHDFSLDDMWEIEVVVTLKNGETFSQTFEGKGGMDNLIEEEIKQEPTKKSSSSSQVASMEKSSPQQERAQAIKDYFLVAFQGILALFALMGLLGIFLQLADFGWPEKKKLQVGNTPLVEVEGVYAKLECANPCGSVKDRIAKYILEKSIEQGLLKPGMTIVEATSGNTGIAFSYFAREMGYKITIVMPEHMTEERKKIIRGFGANLVLCSKEGSFAEAASIRDEMAKDPNYFNPDQFSNPLNVECHYTTTAQEILDQIPKYTSNPIDAFVAGVGTGGTLIGVAKRLRKVYPKIRIAAVEPSESAVMSGGSPGEHSIQGIGDGFIPAIAGDGKGGLHPLIDEVVCISSEEALKAAQYLSEKHGCCVGVSSGANFLAAQKLQKTYPTVVTVFSDGYIKYVSQGLKHCEKGRCRHEHHPLILEEKEK